jgi:hypothetical protein
MENQVFHDAGSPDKIPKPIGKALPSQRTKAKGKQVLVDNSVVFSYDTDGESENYDNIRTLEDVLILHTAKPNVLLGITPPLYSAFMNNTGGIVSYVKVGDKVKYKNPKQADISTNPIRTISSVYFKSLGDMSVICAEFEEGDYSLTNLLTVTNGN